MGEAHGNLLHVVGDHDHRRGRHVPGQPAQGGNQALPAAHIEAGGRFVQQQQGRIAHQGPGDEDLLALAVGEHAEAPVGDGLEAGAGEQAAGPVPFAVVVVVPPGLQGPVPGAHHHLGGRQLGNQLLGDGRGHQADVLAQPAHVVVAQTVAEDVDRPPGGVQVAGRQLEQGGLARPVRAQHDPALPGTDAPVDVVEHRGGDPVEVHGGELERR